MRPDPTDDAMWDKRHPFSLAALRRRKLAERAEESACRAAGPDHPEPILDSVRRPQSLGSAAPNHEGGTQQRPDGHHLSQRRHQGDSNQTSDPEHCHPPVPDDRDQNEKGSNVPLQAQEGQASTPTLPDDKSNNLGGLQPNTIAAIQHLQRRWRARGKDGAEPSLAEELPSWGSDRADVRTDNRSPAISDDHDETRGDKPFAQSHNGRAETQDKDVDEEDIVRPSASKRRKSNRHPSDVEPPAKPQSGRSLRRRLARRRDDSARVEDEDGDDTCQPPSKRRKENSLARPTVLRPPTQRHLHSDDAASRSQPVRTSASRRKRSDRHSILNSPSSQKSIDRKAVFEEWPLENAVLKRVTVGEMTTFQVQFTWDSCAMYGRKDRATEDPQDTYPVRRSPSLRRGGVAGPHFTPEDTLIELTDDDVQPPALTEEEEAEWEFEKILGTRKRGRGHQVLVKWTYFEKPTWEPMKNFLETEALQAYSAQYGES